MSFFDWVTGSDDCLYRSKLWRHDRFQTRSGPERNSDVKRVLVKFSDNPELEYRNKISWGRETLGIELSSRMRWVPIQPSSIGNRDNASSHAGEAQLWSDGGDTMEKVSRER